MTLRQPCCFAAGRADCAVLRSLSVVTVLSSHGVTATAWRVAVSCSAAASVGFSTPAVGHQRGAMQRYIGCGSGGRRAQALAVVETRSRIAAPGTTGAKLYGAALGTAQRLLRCARWDACVHRLAFHCRR